MIKRTRLVLITNEFPYGHGEPYLESELPFLAEFFKEIVITPINVKSSMVREVPENVSVCTYTPVNESSGIWNNIKFHRKALKEYTKEVFQYFRVYGIIPSRSKYLQLTGFLKNGLLIKNFILTLLIKKKWLTSETVIYSYWAAQGAVAAAMVKKDFADLLVISRAHGWDVYFERQITRYIPARPFIFNYVDKVFLISAQGAYYTNAKLGFKFKDKVEVRYLGVQIPSLNGTDKMRCAEMHIVSCAHLTELKRIGLITEALKELRSRFSSPKIHWTHLGGGPLFDDLKKEIEEALCEKEYFTYDFKGELTNKEVMDFYSSHQVDLFLSSSEWEGLPVSIMEAASFSIPIIATDVGGVSEIVIDGRNGWLVPKELKGFLLADKIEQWIQLPADEKKRFRMHSRRIATARFCAKNNYRDWAEELVSSQKK